jgi:cytochrome c oxidase assembly protein subunit 15
VAAVSTPPLSYGPRRVALALAWFTGGLLVLGGLVTTYRVGMAVTDWPTTFGYSMFAYPLDQMVADFGVTVEHSHRMLASTVGLLSLVLVLVTAARTAPAVVAMTGLAVTAEVLLVADVLRVGSTGGGLQVGLLGAVAALLLISLASPARRGPRAVVNGIHLAVIGQGLLGGTRVLENSQHLAFLHGSVAQLVFLLMVMGVVVTSPRFQGAARSVSVAGKGLSSAAWEATGLVYVQIVLGAWLRHTGQPAPLMFHLVFAFAAVAAVLMLVRRLKTVLEEAPCAEREPLRRLRRNLIALLVIQVGLGLASLAAIEFLSGGFAGRVTVIEAVTTSAHVLAGALLLGACAASALWSARLLETRQGEPESASAAALEGGLV